MAIKNKIKEKTQIRMKIGYKLSLLVVVVLTINVINFAIAGVLYRNVVNSEYQHLGKSGIDHISSSVQEIKNNHQLYGQFLIGQDSFVLAVKQADSKALSQKLSVISTNSFLNYATIVGKEGTVLYSTNIESIGKQWGTFSHISGALQGKSTTSYEKNIGSEWGIFTAIPIKDENGKILGVLSLGSDLASGEYIENLKKETGNEYTIFMGDKRINTTLLNTDGTRAIGTKMPDDAKKYIEENKKDYFLQNKLFGANYASIYSPIQDDSGVVIGALYSGVSIDEIKTEVNSIARISTIIAIIISIISVTVMLLYIRRFISMPIKQVTKLANEISKGNMGIKSGEILSLGIKSNDEIGQLAYSLEETVSTLNSYIGEISKVLEYIAEGDLTVGPKLDYRGDLAYIKDSLNYILLNLNKAMESIHVSASEVSGGADQVSAGAQVLSQGTTEQAGEIEQLSALIKDITSKISLNAENATMASNLTEDSQTITVESQSSMQNLGASMQDIQEMTAKMKKVVKTIDDFAFQTNILALNATVEAARAGVHGRGFAVVADEVRNLANKSATAAKETGELIESTVEIVERGVNLSNETRESFDRVVLLVQEVTTKVDGIADASNEQAISASQIVNSVDEISRVIQTNSATAEESAAASEELSHLAYVLNDIVGKFKIQNQSDENNVIEELNQNNIVSNQELVDKY